LWITLAHRVLLVGAGPVGIELAGEIRHVWPEKSIALLGVNDDSLGGPYKPELRAELRRQLIEARVELILGSPLRQAPPTQPGELGKFRMVTLDRLDIDAASGAGQRWPGPASRRGEASAAPRLQLSFRQPADAVSICRLSAISSSISDP
jgi:hypothetical protein